MNKLTNENGVLRTGQTDIWNNHKLLLSYLCPFVKRNNLR